MTPTTPPDVLDEFAQYVQNDIPLRLISIPDMKLVDRYAVQEFYLPSIETISESTVKARLTPRADRENIVRQIVRETVKYAIFSHRWLPRGEPTFKDMTDGTVAAGPGRDKLSHFCEVTASNGINFAWSDTCCIDKSSSSELDEAIRSMFRWYRNAAACIVYLAQTTSLANMEHDEWFERGWTLQELLAPPVSKFFSADWKPLTEEPNDKGHDEVLQRLGAATGCPKDDLRDFKPGPFYVDQRMTWAARRKTTRAEDMAYSLMGIFDVTLQPAYGEGAERSFCRLVEMIMQSNGNASVLNWAGKAAASHSSSALPSSPRCYLGHQPPNSNRKLELKMTSRGLQVPLIRLPVTLVTAVVISGHVVQAKFRLTDDELCKETDNITINIPPRNWFRDIHYSLGVFNYMPPYGNHVTGEPALRRLSTAYLLSRRMAPDLSQPVGRGVVKIQDDLRYYGWKKVPTVTFVHFTLKSVYRREVRVVKKELLEVVYL